MIKIGRKIKKFFGFGTKPAENDTETKGLNDIDIIMGEREITDFENLVIEGGGMKMIAFLGAIESLEHYNILYQIKRLAGSSAGSIIATFLALNCSSTDLHRIILHTNFKKFKDDNKGVIRDTYRLFHNYGWYKGDYMLNFMRLEIQKLTKKTTFTFKDLYNYYHKELYITAYCVDTASTTVFSHKTHPELEIAFAVRMSCSIPGVFAVIKYKGKKYVDGGTLDNYPINIFDDGYNLHKTLGLKLVSNKKVEYKSDNAINFFSSIINGMWNNIEQLHLKNEYWNRTIKVNCESVSTLDFDITQKEIINISKNVYATTNEYLENYKKVKRFN
ncbi:patatin-like phospholipase family protein [bacterium]|nr:patatin-like phospholipase family protein [bacterium]